jgi:hypothetical protein
VIATIGPDHKQVPGMFGAGIRFGQDEIGVGQQTQILLGDPPARAEPRIKPSQLDPENRRLNLIQTAVDPLDLGQAASIETVKTKASHARGQLRIVGDAEAPVAKRAEVLGRIEGEAPDRAERAHVTPGDARAMGLGAVLDDRQPVASGDRLNRLDVGGTAVQVHRQDRSRARAETGFDLGGVDQHGAMVDIDQSRSGAHFPDRADGCRGRVGDRNHFVARTDVQRAERNHNRIGPRSDADGRLGPDVGGELLLERLPLRAEDQLARRQNALDRRFHVVADRLVAAEIIEGLDHACCGK